MLFKTWTNLRIGSGQNVPPDDQASLSKAQQRRAQVRKAQIQHRQRKANYVKTLETDAERYREMIATTRREALAIYAENEAMRAQLLQHSSKLSLGQNLSLKNQITSPTLPRNDDSGYSLLPLEDVTMTLGYDEIMNTPCYYISSSPSSSQFESSVNSSEGGAAPETCAAPNPHLPEMTPQQIQQAINFILAYAFYFLVFLFYFYYTDLLKNSLEHVCRDHSHPSLFSSSPNFPSPDDDCITGSESGHTLMATSLALRSAPPNVFQAARKTKLFPGSSISIRPPAPDSPDAVSWQASGLTLQSLYGLACSLHGEDDAEVTPVQVWFELVARYGVDAVLGGIDQMKKEFTGVVKCPHYGAVMEREAFESVVGRVLGSASG